MADSIPVIDVAPLLLPEATTDEVATKIAAACCQHGFFYVQGHGVSLELQERLTDLSREFFAQPAEEKYKIRMELGGLAWRGYFGMGHELTSGHPDQKEGIYFGSELPDDDSRVQARLPLHGRNLFPSLSGFRDTVLEYLHVMTHLADAILKGIALSLELEASFFQSITDDPTILFRVFHYPPLSSSEEATMWSVGEHTDYGLLTILFQDQTGGLEVKLQGRWIQAPPMKNTFVCNLGDMLDRITGGRYLSTPHRVRNPSEQGRLAFPFFFDPNWNAEVQPVSPNTSEAQPTRWDDACLHDLAGTYGQYLLKKVAKVFPDLGEEHL